MPSPLRENMAKYIKGRCEFLGIPNEEYNFVLVEGNTDSRAFGKIFINGIRIHPCGPREDVLSDILECVKAELKGICIVDRDYFSDDELGTDNIVSFCLDSNNIESFLLKNSIGKGTHSFDSDQLIMRSKHISKLRASHANEKLVFSLSRGRQSLHSDEWVIQGVFDFKGYLEMIEESIPSMARFARKLRRNFPNWFGGSSDSTFEENPWRWINGKDAIFLLTKDPDFPSQDHTFVNQLISDLNEDALETEPNLFEGIRSYENRTGRQMLRTSLH